MSKVKKHSDKSATKGQIRIISGQYRGRKLPVLMADGLRPTTDRVKETVFNWLMPYIQDTNCLDCFAGSGGLGFEAMSRGASYVTLVELNKPAAQQLKDNKALLQADSIQVVQQNALDFLKNNQQNYSLVFIDPPFRKGLAQQTAELLSEKGLTDDALIYVEMEADHNEQIMPSHWQLLKEKVTGQVIYRLYRNSVTQPS
ncbi:MAG: 16S rRNA (guanine966-N2)-methyltransferase [Psychroserpens sp.]|jgi:16S rRNA (guanine966-N2)-methyltransferase